MKKVGKFLWAFFALIAVVIVSGFATLGSVRQTGDSMTYFAGKSAVYKFTGGEAILESVYLNVGAIYEDVGENVKIEVEHSNATTPSSTGVDVAPAYYMANIAGETGTSGWNYNWHKVASGLNVSARFLMFRADSNLELNEIVAFDKKGNRIELEPYTSSYELTSVERAKAIDAQDGITKEWVESRSLRDNFTEEEGITMSAINTLTAKKYEGFKYLADGNFGILATAISALPVAIFGGSTFALRLMPFLAGVAAIALSFLLAKGFFKSEKYAFFTALLFTLGGVVSTVSRIGSGYAYVAAALLASLYFAYKFFSKGISINHPIKSGLNVAFSGVFSAIALVIEPASIIPVAGIIVLFAFGVRRIFSAEKLAVAKVNEEKTDGSEEADVAKKKAILKVKSNYSYKKSVSLGFAFLAFVVFTFLLVLVLGVVFYKPLVLVYDNVGKHSKSVLGLIFANVWDSVRADYASVLSAQSSVTVLTWLLPWKAASVYAATVGEKAIAFGVTLNGGLNVLSLVAFLLATYLVASGFVAKTQDKTALRVRRIYFILLAVMAAVMMAAGVKGLPTVLSATLFSMAFTAFLPLTAFAIEERLGEKATLISDVILYGAAAVGVIFYAINLAVYYGIAI